MNNQNNACFNLNEHSIYVGGAAPNNHDACVRGGIGIAIYDEFSCCVYSDSITVDRPTNSAELALMALVEGLELASDGDTIFSDSDFCVKGFNEWLNGWKARGWRKSDKKPVANRHLWQMVDDLRSSKFVNVLKVKAHAGIEGNEQANELAFCAAHR